MTTVPTASIRLNSFSCPHCGAHAHQAWYDLFAKGIRDGERLPVLPGPGRAEIARQAAETATARGEADKAKTLRRVAGWAEKMMTGEPFLHTEPYINAEVAFENVFASVCHSCSAIAVWVHDRLIYPPQLAGPLPHPDLPQDLRGDFEEARRIVDLSPRGAAALLRLLVQKLCTHLGEQGKNIDDDIAALVSKGLDATVHQALDAVRVIGNEAVHPGQMDLRDDRSTAIVLFELVNDVVAQTVTRRNRAKALYDSLPESKRKAIDERNAKATLKGDAGA